MELQFHSGNLRRGVRHLVLSRRAILAVVLAAGLVLVFLLASMAAAPTVIRRSYRTVHVKEMRQERAVQSQKLREHVQQMATLEKLIDEQRLQVEKLIAVYNLEGPAAGLGGRFEERSGSGSDELSDARRREAALAASLDRLDEQLAVLDRFEHENAEMIRHTPAILPIPADQFVVTDPFGWRISPFTRTSDFHAGLDLAAPVGTPVLAAADGVVAFAGRVPMRSSIFWWRFGNVVAIRHTDRFVTIYGHCERVDVKQGQRIRQGDRIATVGTTGWSTNAHLHYEVRRASENRMEPVDPQIYILNYQWNRERVPSRNAREDEKEGSYEPLPAALSGVKRRG